MDVVSTDQGRFTIKLSKHEHPAKGETHIDPAAEGLLSPFASNSVRRMSCPTDPVTDVHPKRGSDTGAATVHS